MAAPTLDPFKGVTPVYLGNPKDSNNVSSEPSGLTLYSDGGTLWLFMVSDNGIIAKATLSSSTPTQELHWKINDTKDASDKSCDYESVTFAKGNVMVGVEGDRTDGNTLTSPVVKRFDQNSDSYPAGNFTSSSWKLNGMDFGSATNSGMEALTLIPWGSYPSSWSSGKTPYYGGVFFAAIQAKFGSIYVYELAQGSGQSHSASPINLGSGTTLTVPNPATDGSQPLISDMFFDASSRALYVVYDGNAKSGSYSDYLQKLTVSTSSSATAANALRQVWAEKLPWKDCEGVAVNGSDLYVSIDSSSHPENDGVFVLKGVLSTLG